MFAPLSDADSPHREVTSEGIRQGRQVATRRSWRGAAMQCRIGALRNWGVQMHPFRKNGLAASKEDEQIGRAVEVDVYEGPCMFARRGIELLDEIDPVVEVAIGLAPYEGAMFEILVDIGPAVEVGIDDDL